MTRLNYIEKRRKIRRKALQGFPWDGKFETKEEIYSYFSGDKIQCLLCGKWFKRLHTHLKMIHGISSDEYREMYSLPWKHGLCGKEYSLKFRKIMKKRRENGYSTDMDAIRERLKQARKRQDQPFFKKIRAENLISGGKRERTKYFPADFQNVLKRMMDENKTLAEACKDADMPCKSVVLKYSRRNKEFRKALDKTYEKLPFSVQAKATKLSVEKFIKAILSLLQSGFSIIEISRFLGVSGKTIRRRLKSK